MTATNRTKKIERRNGRLTKRETIRRIAARAVFGLSKTRYTDTYVARRINKTPEEARQIVRVTIDEFSPFSVDIKSDGEFVFGF